MFKGGVMFPLWEGRWPSVWLDPRPINSSAIDITRIREICLTLNQYLAFLSLFIILDYVESPCNKIVFTVDSQVGKKIRNFVNIPSDVLEEESTVVVKPSLNVFQTSLKAPTARNVLHMSPIKELGGHINEDFGISLYL